MRRHSSKQGSAWPRGSALKLLAVAALVAGCGGGTASPSLTSSPTKAAATPATTPVGVGPSCGTAPVTLNAYFETGFELAFKLTEEFTKQYPNVTWAITQDQYANLVAATPRVLGGDNAPDVIRLPGGITSIAKDGLLKNLDPYASALGWDKWPPAALAQMRVGGDGTLGSGSLYAMALNYSLTGVFYNKKLAAQIGMTEPPKTVAEFEALLAKAKSAGLQPIMQWNATSSGGGLIFPLEDLMSAYAGPQPINDWIFLKKGATMVAPANTVGAQHLEQWIKAGYFPKDVNAIQYADANARFTHGEGVFMFNGDWQNPDYDKNAKENVGFFLFPPAEAGGSIAAMSTPLKYGVAAKAAHPDCAAFFFNWVATNPTARQIDVTVGGSTPAGPTDLPIPKAAAGSVTNDTLTAGGVVAKNNGAMAIIADATANIYAQGWTPQLQKLVAGTQTPEGMLKAVQAEYEKELAAQK